MRYDLEIELDDKAPRAALTRALITTRLATVLELGNHEGVEVTVRTTHPSMGPTTVHVRDGKVGTEHEPHQPSTAG
jgi:hypothetical protein